MKEEDIDEYEGVEYKDVKELAEKNKSQEK
jgi:hypothetical protein